MSEENVMGYDPRVFSSQFYGEDQNDFTKWRFDVDELLRDLTHDLLGEVKVVDKDGTEKWVTPEDITASMTKEGARELVSLCRASIGKIPSLSVLNDNEIRFVLRRLATSLSDILFDNWEKWKIDQDRLGVTKDKIEHLIFFALKQALNAKTLDSLTKVEQIKRLITGDNKKDGIQLSPFGRGNNQND